MVPLPVTLTLVEESFFKQKPVVLVIVPVSVRAKLPDNPLGKVNATPFNEVLVIVDEMVSFLG